MSAKQKTAYIVSHTHWDREWYLTYHQFRVKLVGIVKGILSKLENDIDFKYFLLDGQAIAVEDYLEVCPEDRERIVKLVKAKRLGIGPWYILSDEFLVSGEATVRNLLIGHQVCAEMGGVQKEGYLPDSFGHPAQIPQILKRAGIDSFIYTRGSGDELTELGLEYIWQGPDGSEVIAINQCDGYCNAGGLGYQEIWEAHTNRAVEVPRAVEQVNQLIGRMAELSNGDIYLVNNGCDHFPVQKDFGKIIAALQESNPEIDFVHTSLSEYIDAVKKARIATKQYSGELVAGKDHLILSGVWSARIYLKQANEFCQTLLEKYVEPVAAYAHFCLGHEYPGGLIEYAWKLLLKNHPHDSICGCSTDEVHAEMETRFEGVDQTGEQILRGVAELVAPNFAAKATDDGQTLLTVINPLPCERTEVVDRLVVLQPGTRLADLELVDQNGKVIGFELLEQKYIERFWNVDYRSELSAQKQLALFGVYLDHYGERIIKSEQESADYDEFIHLQFLAERLPALGHTQFYLRPRDNNSARIPVAGTVEVSGNQISNEFYELTVSRDGRFDLLDKDSGELYRGLNRLEDTEDVGDEYDYSPASISKTIFSDGITGAISVVEATGLVGRLGVLFNLELPESIEADRRERSGRVVPCQCEALITLRTGSRIVEIETRFDNQVRDHRLRVQFPAEVRTDKIESEGQFFINSRPVKVSPKADWAQPPTGTYPQQGFSAVTGADRGLAVLNRGLPEVAPLVDQGGLVGLSLTLLRSVDWLSRDDLPTRKCANAGPTLYTPDALCLGMRTYRYGVMPVNGNLIDSDLSAESDRYRCPVLTKQGVVDNHLAGTSDFLRKTTRMTSITMVKKHVKRSTLLIRLYNMTPNIVEERLVLGLMIEKAWLTNLLEERQAELEVEDGSVVNLELRGSEIVGIEIQFCKK